MKKNIDRVAIQNFKITNDLLKENLIVSRNIYDKIEKGDNYTNLIDLKDYKSSKPNNSTKSNNCLQFFSFGTSNSNNDNRLPIHKIPSKDNIFIDFDNMSANYNKNNSDSEFSDVDDNVETKV
jgi:hypothetical protein